MVVNFMLIGAQKSGTTTLAERLAAHPEICFSTPKEPGYFNRPGDWRAGIEQYHALFAPQPGQICGEGSTMYTFLPEYQGTHERLYAYNPELKLIYIMRHPVERILSNYAHRVARKTVKQPPETAVFADPEYINRTRYGVQLRPYVDLFGRDRILLLVFEEYLADPQRVLAEIADFLAIERSGFAPNRNGEKVAHSSVGDYHLPPTMDRLRNMPVVDSLAGLIPAAIRTPAKQLMGNRLTEKPSFTPALRRELWRFLEDDVAAVEAMLGRPIERWRVREDA